MPPSCTATSASHCSVFFAVSRRPRPPLGPRPRPGVALLRCPTGRVFNRAPGPQPASPPQRGDSTSVPRRPTAPAPPWSTAEHEAATPIAGRPLYFQGAARIQERRLASPRLGTFSPGLPGPNRLLRSRGETRPESPAVLGRPPTRRAGSRPSARSRPRPRGQASGPQARRRAVSAPRHFPGSPRGPNTPGRFRRLDPSTRTSIGPERVRFCMFSRRPLRSEKFRRAPSPGPWPRPTWTWYKVIIP
ncbi:hypothetical protein NDU88_009554 [Pleurodeles waltl]|uniref:Basic proline-rich protein-like n=1 Tax=Pleurodeles waltl TaxID=8319 RepID=A0AAV7QT48_PLEWA|nr:hypothetical protein NDU88_009554 [Pleurodeles waltl]